MRMRVRLPIPRLGWTLKRKLQIGGVSMLLVTLGFGAHAMRSATELAELNRQTYDNALMSAQFSQSARVWYLTLEGAHRQAVTARSVAELEAHAKVATEAATALTEDLEVVRQRALNPRSAELVTEVGRLLDGWAPARQASLDKARQQLEAATAAGGQSPQTVPIEVPAIAGKLDTLSDLAAETGFKLRERATLAATWTLRIGYGALGASVLVITLVCVGLYRSVIPPLRRFGQCLDALASGDLTQEAPVTGRDEVSTMARRYNSGVRNLRETLRAARSAADTVAEAARESSGGAHEMARQAQRQAASLEETAATLEELTATVKQNADGLDQASRLAGGSRDIADTAGHVVTEAVAAMGEINQASRKIADIITTIDEIAFQTNLLALNAAVEAARAGEQGRGFAVVAAEVRNLAQRSATAAREIKALIGDSVTKVAGGSALVNRSGQTLEEIVVSVRRVTDIIGEIAAAGKEQSSGIEQVNRAVTEMDRAVQANAAQAEELSSTAQSLADQAEQLQTLVARFVLDEDAGDTATVGGALVNDAARTAAEIPAELADTRRPTRIRRPLNQAASAHSSLRG